MKFYILILSIQFVICNVSVAQSNSDYRKAIALDIDDFYPSSIERAVFHGENLIISDFKLGLVSINLKTLMVDKTLSKGGRGPGEFEYISDIHFGKHSKKLLLLDSNLFRVSFFSIDNLLFQDSFTLPNLTNVGNDVGTFYPKYIWEVNNGSSINYIILYDQSISMNTDMDKRKKRLVLFDHLFNVIDKEFLELKGDYEHLQIKKDDVFMVTRKLFGVKNLIDFTSDGKVIQSWTEFPCILVDKIEQCLKVDQIEVTKNDLSFLRQNIDANKRIDLVSYIEKTFPFFDDMHVYKYDDSNPDLIWLSRNKGVQELELIEYSLSSKKIIRTLTISGWLKLLAISDSTAYLTPHPNSNANPQILEVSLD